MPQQNRRLRKKFMRSLEKVGKLHRGNIWAEDFSYKETRRSKTVIIGRRIYMSICAVDIQEMFKVSRVARS